MDSIIDKVVIFGTNDFAQLANFYLTMDRGVLVSGFTCHRDFIPKEKPSWMIAPIVAFEELEKTFPPNEYYLFAPMSGAGMNKKREAIYREGKQRGYQFISYVSSKATKFHNQIGENCFILENNTIQPYVKIGNNVVIWSGCHLGHHSIIKDHSFFTSHVVLSGHCIVEPYSWFGVNSTIRDGLTIAEGSLIGMGACLTKSTEPWSAYLGLPAKKVEGKTSLEMNP